MSAVAESAWRQSSASLLWRSRVCRFPMNESQKIAHMPRSSGLRVDGLGLEEHIVAHRVRIGLEEVAVPFRVERVEGEPDAIVPEGKGVALFAIADDLLRIRVPAAKADEEGPAIGHDPDLGPLGRRVTGDRKDLRELVDEAAVQPAGVVHHAVDHGRAFRKAEGDAMVGRRTDPVVAGGDRDRGRRETDEEAEPRDRPSTR